MENENTCLNIEPGRKVFESREIQGKELQIEQIKEMAAQLWSAINVYCADGGESSRLAALAKTDLESSVMWAVKAISRQERDKLALGSARGR